MSQESTHKQSGRQESGRRWWLPTLILLLFAASISGGLLTMIDLKVDEVGLSQDLAGASGVAVSPDGQHVYTVARDDSALSSYFRNPVFGTLSFLESFVDSESGVFGLVGAKSVAVSPDGGYVYVASEGDDTLTVFSREATTDSLTFLAAEVQENNVGGVIGLDGASGVVASSDRQVFVTSMIDDALAVFSRDATTDDHTFVEAEVNNYGMAMDLDGASAVALSPDEKHLYVTADIDDALVVFERNAGEIDFVASYKDGEDGINGLNGACGVAVSPDDAHVYAVGKVDNAVVAFERDMVTGELTFLEYEKDGVNGVDGLDGATSIAVSPNGDRVLVAGEDDNALAVFRRDIVTGELHFLEALMDGVDGVIGLRGTVDVAFSPDGENAYTVGRDDNALAAISIAACIGNTAMGDSDGDAYCDDVDLCTGDDATGDSDGDGWCDDEDICPGSDDSVDSDGDMIPDGCDLCAVNDSAGDSDGDGVCDDIDVCPGDDAADADMDGVCDGLDCAPSDPKASTVDVCGVCGGDGSSCGLFSDGFESGDTSGWSSTQP